jgi:collagenase-like PrtC family protease
MRLSIPTNWADDFFEKVDLSAVTEIFGKLQSDYIGGGRASVLLKKLPLSRFKEHVKEISKRGIVFNYLLNATCMCNKEFSIKGHREICKLLDFISEHEIPMVTVGLPQIVMLIKSKYPHLKVSVSTNCLVDNLERVKYWEEHGVDQITISYTDLNRDFKELERMTKNAKCELQTICNFICRRHCPQQFFHGAYNSHASQTGTMNDILPIDFYLLTCITRFFTNPYEIIRSSFIRPEDLKYFEKIGLDKFKLGERGINTEDLANIVSAYTNRSYDGNLIDLVPTMSKYKIVSEPSVWHMIKYYVRPGMTQGDEGVHQERSVL